MKLYVWVDPYRVSYGSSLLIAIAPDLETAKLTARTSAGYKYGKYDNFTPDIVLGDADRIVELDRPYAEWHEWSE